MFEVVGIAVRDGGCNKRDLLWLSACIADDCRWSGAGSHARARPRAHTDPCLPVGERSSTVVASAVSPAHHSALGVTFSHETGQHLSTSYSMPFLFTHLSLGTS